MLQSQGFAGLPACLRPLATGLLLLAAAIAGGGCTEDAGMRAENLEALARWEDMRLAPQDSLQALLAGPDAHVRLAAVRTAGLIGRNDILPDLTAALDDPSMTIRKEAVWSLGLLQDPAAVPVLEKTAGDPRPALRLAALAALGQVANPGSALLEAAAAADAAEAALAWDGLRNVAADVPPEQLLPAIQGGLTRPETEVRWRVLRCAELSPDSSLIALIVPLARAEHVQVRVHAYRALARLDRRAALQAVIDGFDSHDRFRGRNRSRVDIAGCRALGRLGGLSVEATDPPDDPGPMAALLIRTAGSDDPHAAATALDAMGQVVVGRSLPAEAADQESLLPVWRIRMARAAFADLDSPHTGIRAAAVGAYAALRGAGGIAPILERIPTEKSALVLAAAMAAVSRFDPDPVGRLLHCAEIVYPAGFGEDELPARCSGATRAAAYRGLAHVLRERPDAAGGGRDLARIESHLAAGLDDADFVVAATCAELVSDFPSPGSLAALIRLWRRADGPYVADLQLGVLAGMKGMLDREQSAWTAPDSLRQEAARICRQAFDAPDIRIRREGRAVAVVTGLLPDHLIPTAASLQATVPAFVRSAEQPAVRLPFDAPRIRCETERGSFTIQLDGQIAPNTCAMILDLVESGFYEGLTFHRVVPDFVAQGGDPLGHGWGGPGYTIRSEWSRTPYRRGMVGIAHSGKDTGGCQFFVTLSEQPHLNGRYTICGEVVDGMDTVDRLEVDDRFRLEIVTK